MKIMVQPVDVLDLQNTAEQVARRAGELALRMRGGPLRFVGEVDSKSNEVDVVTAADKAAERLVREELARRRPGETVFGEEEGGRPDALDDEVVWVIDPIDGTVNYLYGFPLYCVSLAAQIRGESVAAVVVDPLNARMFSAARGRGATLTVGSQAPVPLRATGADRLCVSLVGTGFAYDRQRRIRQAGVLAELAGSVRDFRRGGSAALELCAVAAGWLDAYYENGLHRWDWAAGALIAAEAGANVQLPEDSSDLVVASAPAITEELSQALVAAGIDAV